MSITPTRQPENTGNQRVIAYGKQTQQAKTKKASINLPPAMLAQVLSSFGQESRVIAEGVWPHNVRVSKEVLPDDVHELVTALSRNSFF